MDIKIKIVDQGKEFFTTAKSGEILINKLQTSETSVHSPCGGRGTCQKCKVIVEGKGEVLACQTVVSDELCKGRDGQIVVYLPKRSKAKILSIGSLPEHKLNPLVKSHQVTLDTPTLSDQVPDDIRIEDKTGYKVPFNLLMDLSEILRKNKFDINFSVRKDNEEIISIEPSSQQHKNYGVAIDIGTTTIAAFLYDLDTGRHIMSATCLNSQKNYGADVISRIDFASASDENSVQMQSLVYNDIFELLFELTDNIHDVKLVSFSGNTTMMHLLCGINPIAIAKSPFIPTTVSSRVCYMSEIFRCNHKKINYNPACILLPSISGYVGADITAGILTCDMDKSEQTAILIDIGTNGEIVLSRNGSIVACSTAAGPAFEGANLSCGIGGVVGAIDKVFLNDEEITFSTISDETPCGICGSGVVSAISALLESGLIDETGRFEDNIDTLPEVLRNKIVKINNEKAYVFSYVDNKEPSVYLTQRDIREVQNAKAAVCAGIKLLIEKDNLKAKDIDVVYIAGGFGNFLNVKDAFRIGLIPSELEGKTKMIGNTSVIGSSLCLLDIDALQRCESIRKKTMYYELSSDKRFTDLYIDAMIFGE